MKFDPARRRMIGGGALVAASVLLPGAALAPEYASAAMFGTEHRLAVRGVHSGERHDVLFARDGRFLADGLTELNHALRDWRDGQIHAIDRRLLMLAAGVRDALGVDPRQPFDIISAYRSPATNAMLHETTPGVASKSQHLLGKAMDIHLPGVALDRLHNAALVMGGGGVGFYPDSGFVHIDNGPVRRW